MGVHDLWSIIEPVRESVSLYSLSGKTLAVDLSLWVCEAQHVQAMMGRVTKPHLRNLFFRVSSLTLMGIKLVFVMEGTAPRLKSETMSKRTEARYGRVKNSTESSTNTSRGRFNSILKECAEMLDYLGVPWVTAAGEAEAMCAYLDSQGLVDGCITNDGDAFLYGARTVYRNFNMSSKDPQIDCYHTSRVQTELHLSRENLVGLAILLGCDYIPKGIPGVGREQALRLIQALKGQSLLHRFIQWREDNTTMSDVVVKKVPHCNICRHPGSAKAHERRGCTLCNSQQYCQPQDFDYLCPCDWHSYEHTHQAAAFEANIKKKTLSNPQFPFTEIINEFLVSKDKPVSHFKRRQPNMLMMQKFAYDKMEWPKHYTSEKVLVLMTYAELMNRKYGIDASSQIKPIRIVKSRVRNAVACFEVIWRTPEHFVFPEDRPAEDPLEVRTVEEESLFRLAFPELVDSFTRSKALVQETKKKRQKKKEKPFDTVTDLLAKMTLYGSSTQPESLPPSSSNYSQTEVLVLDSPVCNKQLHEEKEDHNNPLVASASEDAASPSVSVVIGALHLSDIDWDASSFTSSPAPQANNATKAEGKTTVKDERREEKAGQEVSDSVKKQEESGSALDLCYTDCSLRDRLLKKNSSKSLTEKEISKFSSVKLDFSENNSKLRGIISEEESTSEDKDQFALKVSKEHNQQQIVAQVQHKTAENDKLCRKREQTALISSQRCNSYPSKSDKKSSKNLQTSKKSVCMSLCSSSEESDVENDNRKHQIRTKTVPNKMKSNFLLELPLKSVPTNKLHRETLNEEVKPLESKNQDTRVPETDGVFVQSPGSPVIVLDDSVTCSDSPLPLAERLRLKFLK
ncbi:flap endonuclease GEN homolog 1 [Oryzias melastigma]|uniref:Flap endonuclease GEN homolog 1 n=1 Tax=Oryzias melastigma TaxID=30732 RepID=A0A3B3DCK8_ORYME|nr:flap endonuclease GEN homolog 1 [Oryzias melastigma]